MNKYKNKVLSVLLLAFTFFVLHDYVIQNTSETTSIVSSEKIDKDITCQIHDNIHTMFETSLDIQNVVYLTFSSIKPSILESTSTSYISLVPNKPPVI